MKVDQELINILMAFFIGVSLSFMSIRVVLVMTTLVVIGIMVSSIGLFIYLLFRKFKDE